jgi:hypothetical protein
MVKANKEAKFAAAMAGSVISEACYRIQFLETVTVLEVPSSVLGPSKT